MTASLPDDVAARLRRLPPADQERALAYVRALEQAGAPAPLLGVVGLIPSAELQSMAAAIEADCERIDAASW
jgi:hypothetical protein